LLGALALVAVLASPAAAAMMCHLNGAATERLGSLTAGASAKFLEASSQALLVYKALEESAPVFGESRARTLELLDATIAEYRKALELKDDLVRADEFIKARPFERLRVTFGITPGSLSAMRWEAMARMARTSHTQTADLIGICLGGAQSLKATIAQLKPDMSPAQARRSAIAWIMVLSHGALVSDAFDSSVR
jgi:hypothetical protein